MSKTTKYYATCRLHCGLGKVFTPGEEVPCDEKLGLTLVADGSATTDAKLAKRLAEEEQARLDAAAAAREAAMAEPVEGEEGETEGVGQGEQLGGTELPPAKVKASKKSAKKAPAKKAKVVGVETKAVPPKKKGGKGK